MVSLHVHIESAKGSQCGLTQAYAAIIRRDGAIGPNV
jgi:hypothetical protein